MKLLLFYITFCFSAFIYSQQNLLPLNSFYKDQLFANKCQTSYNEGSFFPVSEGEYNLIPAINDSSKQYYDFTNVLFKKHLFEIAGDDYAISISPLFNFSGGKDVSDTIERSLFQNTRGFIVEVDLFKNFSFSSSFYENQARFTGYESNYYSKLGERYTQPDSTYAHINAVIPGGGRTKAFKGDGFDYAFAIGNMSYLLHPKLRISAGNNAQFIGDGYRSILLSDNSFNAPYYRVDWKISNKFSFNYMRSRLMNLLRKPISSSAENYYEAKGYSVNYFTYKPTKFVNISLFEGVIWNRGDSLISKSSNPLFYNPIPIISELILKDQTELNTLLGLNLSTQIFPKHRVYGQVAATNLDFSIIAFQLGYRGYNFFGLNDFMVQVEFNSVPNKFYQSVNSRLNYSHYNLPLAHVKSNGFQEALLRINYEFKRIYTELSAHYYTVKDYASDVLIAANNSPNTNTGNIVYGKLEVGYRFNRKVNFTAFTSAVYRKSDFEKLPTTSFNLGIKTSLLNHYTDF